MAVEEMGMRKIISVLVGLVLAPGALVTVVTPAHAEGVWNRSAPIAYPSAPVAHTSDRRIPEYRLVGPCYVNTICFYDTSTSSAPFRNIEDVDAPRNQCFNLSPYTSYIVNTSNFVWVVATNSDCSGTRANIYAHSEGPMNSFWNNNIRGVFRTSTTG